MTVVGFLVLIAALSWYEVGRIRRYGGGTKELVVYAAAALVATVVGIFLILGISLPNPAVFIEALFRPLGEKVLGGGAS